MNTLPRVIEAAKIAHAHQFIQDLPHGYDTIDRPARAITSSPTSSSGSHWPGPISTTPRS